jgi:hypothetical protein
MRPTPRALDPWAIAKDRQAGGTAVLEDGVRDL